MRKILSFVIATTGLALAACASLAPEPCTGDWVKWRTDQVTRDFRREFSGEMRNLASFSRQLENPSPFVLLQMTARLEGFQSMARDFAETVMPELRSAVDQCGTPTKFVGAFSDLLRDEGVDGQVLDWVEATASLVEGYIPTE